MNQDTIRNLNQLRAPFPPDCINQLPKGGAMLDYVSHAHVTERLLEVDPAWSWEPFALDERGLPLMEYDAQGKPVGLWIRLTVCGVTRPGYGTCEARKQEAVKELIGDALRNAAMRFGVALDLWKKDAPSEHGHRQQERQRPPQHQPPPPQSPQQRAPLHDVAGDNIPRQLSAMQELQQHFTQCGYPGSNHPEHILNALNREGFQGRTVRTQDVPRCKSLLDQHYTQNRTDNRRTSARELSEQTA